MAAELNSPQGLAALWMGLAFVASLFSIRLGISVALTEIVLGAVAGNLLGLEPNEWVNFLAALGGVLLTYLAGAEVEPWVLRARFRETVSIGLVAFAAPFLGAFLFALAVAGWDVRAAQIAGLALSTTSVAVVYAVMVETGLNETELGKIILAACFVNDLATVVMLGVLFANFSVCSRRSGGGPASRRSGWCSCSCWGWAGWRWQVAARRCFRPICWGWPRPCCWPASGRRCSACVPSLSVS